MMAPIRSAKGFLQYGGIVLALVGVLGFFLIGPTPERSIFGSYWVFTMAENWVHLLLGVVALIAAYALKDDTQLKGLVYVVGVIALFFGVYGFFLQKEMPNLWGVANLENPLDNILHLVVAIWAFWAASGKGMLGLGSTSSSNP